MTVSVRVCGQQTGSFARIPCSCVRMRPTDFLKSDRVNDTWCVIADVQMPGMTGIELQEILQAKGVAADRFSSRLFLTKRSSARDGRQERVGFLSKPFESRN